MGTLAKLAASCPDLFDSIMVLLKRCIKDNDDEVRDRAAYCIALLEDREGRGLDDIMNDFVLPWADLEYSLGLYLQEPSAEPFTDGDIVKARVSGGEDADTDAVMDPAEKGSVLANSL